MIDCPRCHSPSSVIDTRSVGGYARRRRVCDRVDCNQRFTTMEMVATRAMTGGIVDPIVISRRSIQKIVKVLAECFTGRTGSAAVSELFRSLVPESLEPNQTEKVSHGEEQDQGEAEEQASAEVITSIAIEGGLAGG